jgi:hypothetical protein
MGQPIPVPNPSRVHGDKRTGRHRAAKILARSIGRCVLSALRLHANLRRCGGPKRATKGKHEAVCQEVFGFWPGSDTRAWPALRRAIAPQVESTGYTEHMPRPHASRRADRLPGRRGLAGREGPHRPRCFEVTGSSIVTLHCGSWLTRVLLGVFFQDRFRFREFVLPSEGTA